MNGTCGGCDAERVRLIRWSWNDKHYCPRCYQELEHLRTNYRIPGEEDE